MVNQSAPFHRKVSTPYKIEVKNLSIWYGKIQAIKNLTFNIYQNEILSIIGPANSGKTSFLRHLNRLSDLETNFKKNGEVFLAGENIDKIKPETLRKRAGMIFALPQVLPLSIFDNIAYGPRLHGIRNKQSLEQLVEETLKASFLWEEVKDRLLSSAMTLSGGQQQRLCLSRTLAVKPEVILFDEPCSGLDPISTGKVEETMLELKEKYTLILVTNNTKQAARVSDRTAFFLSGELIEINHTSEIFTAPNDQRTEDYILGKFG